ncbi:MAG: hypothetical protein U1E54_00410 [Candidatus Levybacteria bacterium]|nr:hypothetical protein [Candidatus Levybacteria bacterium]
MLENLKFIFKGHESNLEKGEVFFHFGFRGEKNIDFTEKIFFPPVKNKITEALLKSLLDNLMLILGISYWKLYCPKEIVIKNNFLTKEQAEFWNTVYTKGLGEFFYKNKLDFRGLINFPSTKQNSEKLNYFPRRDRSLLGIGGGKDSIVAAELLRKTNKELDLATSGFPIQIEIAKLIGGQVINTFRQIDPKLLELNKEKGVYSGHIPISVYYAFLLLLMAAAFDYRYAVVGNEKSANYGNVEYLGEVINHQWSKSEEFETLFNKYVKKFITPDITYSSPLRQMTELQVVEGFVKYPKYFKTFSSCNKNFKINGALRQFQGLWCGECPKCLFVFLCLAAFLPKQEIMNIFGKNLFEDVSLTSLFEELIGVRNFKPFECVGTPEEVKEALKKILEKGKFNDSILMKHFKTL